MLKHSTWGLTIGEKIDYCDPKAFEMFSYLYTKLERLFSMYNVYTFLRMYSVHKNIIALLKVGSWSFEGFIILLIYFSELSECTFVQRNN